MDISGAMSAKCVKVALINADIHWKNKAANLERLLALNRAAARAGAGLILNPELSTSGYVLTAAGK